MKLWCFDDKQSSWGRMLYVDALRAGHEAELFKNSRQITEPGFLFTRIEQARVKPQREDFLAALDLPGIIGITNREDILEYEDKLYQTKKYKKFMPDTRIVHSIEQAHAQLDDLGYPLISKSRSGSGSASVRIHADRKAAIDEAEIVFSRGLHIDRGVQSGYLIWQKFLHDNDYAYRVTKVGRWYWAIRIYNRPNVPKASGSGKMEPVWPDTFEEHEMFAVALKFFECSESQWSGIDLLYDHDDGSWKLLETTLAWNLHNRGGNVDCPVFDANGLLSTKGWIGAHQFEILLYELEQGVFGG